MQELKFKQKQDVWIIDSWTCTFRPKVRRGNVMDYSVYTDEYLVHVTGHESPFYRLESEVFLTEDDATKHLAKQGYVYNPKICEFEKAVVEKKLRLLLFEDCMRGCAGCCNKDWDIDELKVEQDYTGYKCIMLTGGEPMLRPNVVFQAIRDIREQTDCPIYLYTADTENKRMLSRVLDMIDGVTLTLHDKRDVEAFLEFDEYYKRDGKFSFRLNAFKEVGEFKCSDRWVVKDNIEWIENCPLPQNEVFMRYDDSNPSFKKKTCPKCGEPMLYWEAQPGLYWWSCSNCNCSTPLHHMNAPKKFF